MGLMIFGINYGRLWCFINAVQTYNNVVTHYLSSKMELCIGIFMKPLFDIISGSLTFEFAKSRGAIHCHCIMCCRDENNTKLLALQIQYDLDIVNKHIVTTYVAETHDSIFSLLPNKINNVKFDETKRQLFCEINNDVVRTAVWKKIIQYKNKCHPACRRTTWRALWITTLSRSNSHRQVPRGVVEAWWASHWFLSTN